MTLTMKTMILKCINEMEKINVEFLVFLKFWVWVDDLYWNLSFYKPILGTQLVIYIKLQNTIATNIWYIGCLLKDIIDLKKVY